MITIVNGKLFSLLSHQLFIAGHPTEVEDIDNLILASQWAGVAHIRQVSLSNAVLVSVIAS